MPAKGTAARAAVRTLTFYERDHVLVDAIGLRANFLRDAGGRVVWLRFGDRLFRRLG